MARDRSQVARVTAILSAEPFLTRLIRNRYNSLDKIPCYSGPLLQAHGTADRIVPFDLAEKLFAAATTRDKKFVRVSSADHNDPPAREFILALAEFIDRLCRQSG